MSSFFTTSELTNTEALNAYNGYIQIVQPTCANKIAEAEKKTGKKYSSTERAKLQKQCEEEFFKGHDVVIKPGYGIISIKPKAGTTGETRPTNFLDELGLTELAESPYLLIGGAVVGLIVVGVLVGRAFR